MSHSHLPVQHLLKQVELYRSNRNNRDVRPAWVTRFIEQVAELFDPLHDVARAGFECRLDEDGWHVSMFLGTTEMVGGKEDGRHRHCNFEFDLLQLLNLFAEVERFSWNAFPEAADVAAVPGFIAIDGSVGDNAMRLCIHAIPPADAGPGFHQFPNGERDPV